jgi:hypothetical protein
MARIGPIAEFVRVRVKYMKSRPAGVAMVADNRRGSCRKKTFGASLSTPYLKAPEVTRRNTRVHCIHPFKERIVREVGYGLSLEGASAADLVKSMRAAQQAGT